MRQGRLGKLAPLLGLLFLVACPVVAQPSGGALHVLHDSLGEVIDAEENARYNIFGEVAGFTAARIHQVGTGDLELHLLRNAEGRAQIAIIRLPLHGDPGYSTMRSIVANRIGAARTEAVQFDTAIYPVRESSWAERSVNKKLLLRDGSQLIVTFKRAQGDTLFVQTAGGLQIPVPDINIAKVIDLRGEIIEGRFVRTDPNTSRLLFAPTGRQLSAGTGYFADYYVFFPTLAFGVTDFLALSGGMSLLPGLDSQLLYFAPKLTLRPSPNTGLAMGFLYLAIPEDEDDLNLGYVVTTLGGDRGGTTIGVGLPLSSDTGRDPIFLIGGEAQISNSAKLITENWIFTGGDDFTLFSGGIRFFGDKLAVDLALITAKEAWEEDGFPFAPWVDFSVFFGR